MKELKNCKCTLATDVYLAHMKGEKDGKPYDFISTRVRDGEGHIHGVAIQPMVWNALGKCSALDTVTLEGTLLVPEEGDEGYSESVVTRKRTGETYVSGDLVDAKPVSVVKSPFDAENFAKAENIPVYQKKATATIQV